MDTSAPLLILMLAGLSLAYREMFLVDKECDLPFFIWMTEDSHININLPINCLLCTTHLNILYTIDCLLLILTTVFFFFSFLPANSSCYPINKTNDIDVQYATIEGRIGSDLFLPCFFNITLISQAECNNTAVIWQYTSRNNSQQISIVEFQIQSSEPRPWGKWGQHIKSYPNQTKNGNFSITILNMDLEDNENISCILYDGYNYIRAKRILQLLIKDKDPAKNCLLLPLTISGVLVFLLVAVLVVYVLKIRGLRTQKCETRTDRTFYTTTICDQRVTKENEIYGKIWHD
ncbi:uncharacterized protein ACMZJ9_001331 [Mantella aurantiaca]